MWPKMEEVRQSAQTLRRYLENATPINAVSSSSFKWPGWYYNIALDMLLKKIFFDTILFSLPYPPSYSTVEFDVWCLLQKNQSFQSYRSLLSGVPKVTRTFFTGQKLKKKKKSESGDQIAPTFTLKHTKVTILGKTISGSSSSCFLPPLLLHCPQVPPILKPHGLLISPKDPREEWWTKKFSLRWRGYTMTWSLSSPMFNGLLEQGHLLTEKMIFSSRRWSAPVGGHLLRIHDLSADSGNQTMQDCGKYLIS